MDSLYNYKCMNDTYKYSSKGLPTFSWVEPRNGERNGARGLLAKPMNKTPKTVGICSVWGHCNELPWGLQSNLAQDRGA